MVLVRFSVRCETEPGQVVRLVGTHAHLGGWDPLRGIELGSEDKLKWSKVVKLPQDVEFTYKYVLMSLVDGDVVSQRSGGMSSLSRERGPKVVRWEMMESGRSFVVPPTNVRIDDGEFNVLPDPLVHVRITEMDSNTERSMSVGARGGSALYDEEDPAHKNTLIIVLYRLPIIARRDATSDEWSFAWDDDALYLTSRGLRDGLKEGMRVLWVGIINSDEEVRPEEREQVSATLLEEFNCVPVFIPRQTLVEFYQGFCKGVLWPLFHMLTPLTDEHERTVQFDKNLWHTYCLVNRKFSDKVVELYHEENLIWIHDYHLMVLPSQLRRRLSGAKIGFFLHIPWPSSEAYRTLPVRDELLRGLLSSTLLGFHLFDYARHFLSACVRLLNLEHEASRGILGVEYSGRHVMIRVSHIGIDPNRFRTHLGSKDVDDMRKTLLTQVHALSVSGERDNRMYILAAIDDLDVFKGISLKLLAFESLLQTYSLYQGRIVIVQVAIPRKARVKSHVQGEIQDLVKRINDRFGTPGYQPVLYIERDISFDERIAIYTEADALLLTPIRDGLNLIPYEYILCSGSGRGQLILSEFTGCSRALSSAVRLNPWNYDEVMGAIDRVLQKDKEEVALKHSADLKYVESHPTAKWAESFLSDLYKASEPVKKLTKLGLGLGVGLRTLEFEGFEALNPEKVLKVYDKAEGLGRRLFLLDYDGTLTSSTCSSRMSHAWARPSDAVMNYLSTLAKDPQNLVYIMSGRTTEVLSTSFQGLSAIGLAAEHGFFFRNPHETEWRQLHEVNDLSWREVALEIMGAYAERTDGSYIEEKNAGLVWHYMDADPEFGNWQAKEMRDHLETVLGAFQVQVVTGHGWLQVRLANMNKGAMVQRILSDLSEEKNGSAPSFVLCVGDDRTDEDMFTLLSRDLGDLSQALFTCTVGVKPSNARYYLRTSEEVADVLGLIAVSKQRQGSSAKTSSNGGVIKKGGVTDLRTLASK
ncbi:Alpha,alpha-trehalose-phosphate synthase UDP-forming 5 [Porphyridium purpureum]|uniref:Alpha,alpha-trehalose-phosphate synthase UDP-forming 5 n=1 Tax=Porphyridium purpureum TaxID=35688 RepID=A0A5J4Z3C2_PORPP|nr:Alpha,alpha-trehalose-phosphate synthase UDP-forming 5 [Porphyridium purpureum]|eukprot:POR7014..scf295_1